MFSVLQVFSPWFPSIVDRHLPLRPARHPPKILSAPAPSLQVQTGSGSKPDSPSKRCWTVFRHRVQTKDRTKDQTKVKCRVQTSSRRFLQTVSKLRLHPRQRVKWVWRCLSWPSLSALPSSCNAHIVRDQAQIWLYCDLVQSEEVGLRLKEELSLRGRISLWERSHGNIYCL
uniref:Uncharacterized protein n=1 Tax=Periophthalmus magnuspinnatus TaxID=409849 RepID=A0A3B4BFT7_9GOBI